MNTGFLGPAVATVLTVYGIETSLANIRSKIVDSLQQYLPFMVCDDVTSTFLTYNYISIIKRAVLSVCITEAQLFHS